MPMAFVAFGKKNVSNQQQQQQQQQLQFEELQRTYAEVEAALEPAGPSAQQQQPEARNSAATNRGSLDLTSAIARFNDEELFAMNHGDTFPDATLCESPIFPAGAQQQPRPGLLDADVVGSIPQIVEHNLVLRKNFDTLKDLHLQLSESHSQLRDAYASLHNDQKTSQAKQLSLLKNNEITTLAHELEQRNQALERKVTGVQDENKDLVLKLDSVRKEKEQVLVAKHTAELEYTKELSIARVDDHTFRQQAADLAHKCKHLEIDLEKSVTAGDAMQQQLVSLAYEKDSTIMDLEQALRRVREDLQSTERRYRAHESEWEDERKKIQSKLDDRDRQEQTMRSTIKEEAELKLQGALKEVADLRGMLVTLEKPRADAELLHVQTVRELTKELETSRREAGTALAAEKAASGRLVDMENMKLQLETFRSQSKECLDQISHLKRANEELGNETEALRCKLVELGTIRDVECNEHAKQLESLQRRWAAEKSAAVQRAERNTKQIQKSCNSQIDSLKKKLKQTQKSLATITVDRNQLLVRAREGEAQLAIFHTPKFYTPFPTAIFPNVPQPLDRIVDSTTATDIRNQTLQHQAKFFAIPQTNMR